MRLLRARVVVGPTATIVALAAAIFGLTGPAPAAAVGETLTATADGQWSVVGNGNGHGHGLSQYGARGAARRGLSAAKIIAFYYPGTALASVAGSSIRVRIAGSGSDTTVGVAPGLRLTWAGGSSALDVGSGITRWRLSPSGTGLRAFYLSRTGWHPSVVIPATRADLSDPASVVRTFQADGSSTIYRGTVGAVRQGAGLISVNRTSLENYVKGVVPREMPASWEPAAVQAQSIAARSYARYEVEHAEAAVSDICDTTQCQVYGGMAHYDAAGNLQYGEVAAANAAVDATAGMVARYQGATIFAQFSASDGGWTVAAGQPYLIAEADPYESYANDPYLGWRRDVSQSAVANHYGLTSLTGVTVLRDGRGQWGGRIVSATVNGRRGDAPASVPTSGSELASAMGLPHAWFTVSTHLTFGRVDVAKMTGLHTAAFAGWVLDPDHPDSSASVHTYVDAVGAAAVADRPRPDVQRAYRATTANLGFQVTRYVPGGTHKVCAFAIDLDTSARLNSLMKCLTVTVAVSPLGALDSVRPTGPGRVVATGWTFDPDRGGGAGKIHIYVDGTAYGFDARNLRPDVQAHYRLTNSAVGFSVTVPVPAGRHQLCAYAINTVGAGTNQTIRCVSVTG